MPGDTLGRYGGRNAAMSAAGALALRAAESAVRGYARGAGRSYGSAPKRRKTHKKKSRSKGVVRRDGVGTGMRIKAKSRRGKHKKKSLKKRISALEKKRPADSKIWALETSYWCHDEATVDVSVYYEIPMIQKSIIESTTRELTNNEIQTHCKVSNQRATYELKNNATGNAHVEYQLFKCTGNTAESILFDLREDLQNIAEPSTPIATLPAIDAFTPHGANNSRIPKRLKLGGTEQHAPLWQGNRSSPCWNPTGPIKKALVGPGDTITISYNSGPLTYDVDYIAEADGGTLFYKGLDVLLVIKMTGPMGHDSGVNVLNVGKGFHRFDAMQTVSTRAFNSDGQGTSQLLFGTQDDASGITGIEFADNVISGIQQALS